VSTDDMTTSQLYVILTLLLAQLMMLVSCVVDVDDRFTDRPRLPPYSDINGQSRHRQRTQLRRSLYICDQDIY